MSDLKKVISIDLSDNTKQGFEGIEQTFKDVDNSIKKAETTSGNLRLELKQLQKDLLSGKFTGEEFTKATQRAGELKDTIGDLNSTIKVLASDTRTLDGLVGATEGIAGGFALAQGAAGLFGKENGALEKSLLKVQSSMAILQGLQSVANTLQKESAARILVTTAAQNLYTFAVGGSSGALKVFRLALAGTGIGLIVIALVELYQNFDKVKAAVLNLVPGLSLVGDFLGGIIDQVTDFVGITSEASREIDGLVKSAQKSAEASQRFLDTQGYKYDEYTKRKIQANIDYAANVKKTNDDEKLSEQQKLADIKAYREKANFEITQADKERAAEKKKIRDEEDKKEKARKQKEADALKAIEEKRLADELALAKEVMDKERSLREAQETPLQKEEREYQEWLVKYKANNLNTELLTKQHLENIAKITKTESDKKVDKEDSEWLKLQQLTLEKDDYDKLVLTQKYEAEYLAAEGNAQLQTELKKKLDKDLADIDDANAEKELAKEKAKQAAKFQLAQDGLSLVSGLAELFAGKSEKQQRKAFEIQKAVSLASAIISGIEGTQNAYTTAQKSPLTEVFPAYPLVQAGLAAAFSAVKVAQISKQQFNGGAAAGGGGGGAAGGGGGVAAPQAQFNIVGQSSTNQLAGTIAGQQKQPIQAYVVGSDVSTQQALDRNKINNSTII